MRAYTYGVGLRLLLVEILRRKLAVCRRYVAQQKNTQLEYEKNCILAVSSIYGIDPDKSGLHLHQKQARTPAYPDIAKEFNDSFSCRPAIATVALNKASNLRCLPIILKILLAKVLLFSLLQGCLIFREDYNEKTFASLRNLYKIKKKILTKYSNRLLVEESFDAFFGGFFEGLVLDFNVCHLGIARDEFV